MRPHTCQQGLCDAGHFPSVSSCLPLGPTVSTADWNRDTVVTYFLIFFCCSVGEIPLSLSLGGGEAQEAVMKEFFLLYYMT